MKILKKALTTLGGIFLAALFVAALAPKATHGLVAALVQVSNTVSTPAVAQDVSHLASQNVELLCAEGGPCMNRVASTFATYEVPAGQNFVVTDMEVFTQSGGGAAGCFISLTAPPPGVADFNDFFDFASDGRTHQLLFPTGMSYPGGYKFDTTNVEITSGCNQIWLRGYLTPN